MRLFNLNLIFYRKSLRNNRTVYLRNSDNCNSRKDTGKGQQFVQTYGAPTMNSFGGDIISNDTITIVYTIIKMNLLAKNVMQIVEAFWEFFEKECYQISFDLRTSHLKECEFRFNHRGEDSLAILIKIYS